MRFFAFILALSTLSTPFLAQAMCIHGMDGTPGYTSTGISAESAHQVIVDYVTRAKLSKELGGGVYGDSSCSVSVSEVGADRSFDVTVSTFWWSVTTKVDATLTAFVNCGQTGEVTADQVRSLQGANLQLNTYYEKVGGATDISVQKPMADGWIFLGEHYLSCAPKPQDSKI